MSIIVDNDSDNVVNTKAVSGLISRPSFIYDIISSVSSYNAGTTALNVSYSFKSSVLTSFNLYLNILINAFHILFAYYRNVG